MIPVVILAAALSLPSGRVSSISAPRHSLSPPWTRTDEDEWESVTGTGYHRLLLVYDPGTIHAWPTRFSSGTVTASSDLLPDLAVLPPVEHVTATPIEDGPPCGGRVDDPEVGRCLDRWHKRHGQ